MPPQPRRLQPRRLLRPQLYSMEFYEMLKSKLTPEAMNWIKLRMKVLKDLIKRVPAAEL
mgnify:CR=1 FL=1